MPFRDSPFHSETCACVRCEAPAYTGQGHNDYPAEYDMPDEPEEGEDDQHEGDYEAWLYDQQESDDHGPPDSLHFNVD